MNDDEQNKKRVAITKKAMEAAYERCLKREYDRERKHRDSKQGAFQASMVSVDALLEYGDEDKLRILATGRTLGSVIAEPGRVDKIEVERRKLDIVLKDLRRHGEYTMATVLRLIHKNRENRKESIWELMKLCKNLIGQPKSCILGTETCSASSSESRSTRKMNRMPKRPRSINQPEKK